MADISLEAVTGKLNRIGYEAFIQALRHAKGAGNRNVELAHWLLHILQDDRTDIGLTGDHFKLDRAKLLADIGTAIDGFRKNETEMPGISNVVIDVLDRGWHYATLFFGETQIRTGHHPGRRILKSRELRRPLMNISKEFAKINVDAAFAPNIGRSGPAPKRTICGRWTARGCAQPERPARKLPPPRAPPRSIASRRTSPRRRRPARWTRSSAATRKSGRSSTC